MDMEEKTDELDLTLAETGQSNLQPTDQTKDNGDSSGENQPDASHKKIEAPASEPIKEVKEPIKEVKEAPKMPNNPDNWFKVMNWSENPFVLNIIPELFVGYKTQAEELARLVKEKHKVIMIIGPTGSGKTTLMEWLSNNLDDRFDFLFVGKPPQKPEEFVDIFNEKYPRFLRKLKNIYQIPNFLNKKLRSKHLIVLYDEAHESKMDVLEWLRVLSDQVDNMSIILAGLPVFEEHLAKLETLRKRIMGKIELVSLTKEETQEMIRKRIRSAGGSGEEFNELIDAIYSMSGGFPREIIKVCNDVVNESMKSGKPLTKELIAREPAAEELKVSLRFLEELSPMQREIVEMLANPMTPGQIANNLDLTKYKSRQHAVRSMNNILKRLMDDGLVERSKEDRAYLYQLSPSIRSIVVRA